MNYERLTKLVRPGAGHFILKAGGGTVLTEIYIEGTDGTLTFPSWQSAFESLTPAEQAEARVRSVYPDARVTTYPEWNDDGGRGYAIHQRAERVSKICPTPESAWLDAEKNLGERTEG